MIVVRCELHSAIDGSVTELGRVTIANVGGTATRGNYAGRALRGRSAAQLDRGQVEHEGRVESYPRQSLHVWNLVARMLAAMGYA